MGTDVGEGIGLGLTTVTTAGAGVDGSGLGRGFDVGMFCAVHARMIKVNDRSEGNTKYFLFIGESLIIS